MQDEIRALSEHVRGMGIILERLCRTLPDDTRTHTRKRPRSASPPPPRISRDTVHISGLHLIDVGDFKKNFEEAYSTKIRDFNISRDNCWARVTFREESHQVECLQDRDVWEESFPGLRIEARRYKG